MRLYNGYYRNYINYKYERDPFVPSMDVKLYNPIFDNGEPAGMVESTDGVVENFKDVAENHKFNNYYAEKRGYDIPEVDD